MADDLELYDANGDLITDAKEKFVLKEEAEKVRAELEDAKKRLAGLEDKDRNFKNLRTKKLSELADEEREKLSVKEVELFQRQEAVEEQTRKVSEEQEKFTKRMQEEYRDDAIAALVGEDEETRKKVLFHYDRLRDEAETKEDIRKKVRDAVRLTRDEGESSPLFRHAPNLGSESPRASHKGFAETERGKAFAKSLGLMIGQEKK